MSVERWFDVHEYKNLKSGEGKHGLLKYWLVFQIR